MSPSRDLPSSVSAPPLSPAVRRALAGADHAEVAGLPWGLLHGDPAPEAFLVVRGPTPRCGLVDWSSAVHGSLLYDVASALLYAGGAGRGRPLLDAYAAATGADAGDLLPRVRALLVLRWAVQADYFARRLVTGDLTGVDDVSANRRGLADARRALDGADGAVGRQVGGVPDVGGTSIPGCAASTPGSWPTSSATSCRGGPTCR